MLKRFSVISIATFLSCTVQLSGVTAAQASETVPNDGFDDNPEVLSPPRVVGPIFSCTSSVTVTGFVPHAEIEVLVNGSSITTERGGPSSEVTITLPMTLTGGELVTAKQIFDGVPSAPSDKVTVLDTLATFPSGLPQPQVTPVPVYECARVVASRDHVPGARLRVFTALWNPGTETHDPEDRAGEADSSSAHVFGVSVDPSKFQPAALVTTSYEICGVPSGPSVPEALLPAPKKTPTPKIIGNLYVGQEVVRFGDLLNGSLLEARVDGTSVGWVAGYGSVHAPTGVPPTNEYSVNIGVKLAEGQQVTGKQLLCSESDELVPVTVKGCSELPPPKIAAPNFGDTFVTITEAVPGSRIKIYGGTTKIGDGGGSTIALTRPIAAGETISAVQSLDACVSSLAFQVGATCAEPPVGPALVGAGPVDMMDFEADERSMPVLGGTGKLRGRVYFPHVSEESGYATSPVLGTGSGGSPIVFVLHGAAGTFVSTDGTTLTCINTGVPSNVHRGYDYLLQQFASQGYIAVSIDSSEHNCSSVPETTPAQSESNVNARANLLRKHIELFRDASMGAVAPFGGAFIGKIDPNKTVLIGHSRGASAVLRVAHSIGVSGARVRGVLPVAPATREVVVGPPLFVLLPAADGDVVGLNGAYAYDKADGPYRGQLYLHGANHNWFNTSIPQDDAAETRVGPQLLFTRITGAEQRAVLSSYASAFVRYATQDEFWRDFPTTEDSTRQALEDAYRFTGLRNDKIFLSWERRAAAVGFEHHEAAPNLLNDWGGSVSSSGAFTRFDEFLFKWDCSSSDPTCFTTTYPGHTNGLGLEWGAPGAEFNHAIPTTHRDQSGSRVLAFRVARVAGAETEDGTSPDIAVRIVDSLGGISTLNSESLRHIPAVFPRIAHSEDSDSDGVPDFPASVNYRKKTILNTLRIPLACFKSGASDPLTLTHVQEVSVVAQGSKGTLVFDDFGFAR